MSDARDAPAESAHAATKKALDLREQDEDNENTSGGPSKVVGGPSSAGKVDMFVTEWSSQCCEDDSEATVLRRPGKTAMKADPGPHGPLRLIGPKQ